MVPALASFLVLASASAGGPADLTEAAVSSRFVHLPKPIVVHVEQVIHQNYVAIRLGAPAMLHRGVSAVVTDL